MAPLNRVPYDASVFGHLLPRPDAARLEPPLVKLRISCSR